jgi:hypothetical protein
MALTGAERQARLRAKLAEGKRPVHYRQPADRRSRPQRWADATAAMGTILDEYQAWRERLPASLAEAAIAQRLDAVLELRDLVDQLVGADLPKGFGRT